MLLSEEHRWKMLVKALAPYDGLVANDIELHMPKPNYTAHTLQKLTTANLQRPKRHPADTAKD